MWLFYLTVNSRVISSLCLRHLFSYVKTCMMLSRLLINWWCLSEMTNTQRYFVVSHGIMVSLWDYLLAHGEKNGEKQILIHFSFKVKSWELDTGMYWFRLKVRLIQSPFWQYQQFSREKTRTGKARLSS